MTKRSKYVGGIGGKKRTFKTDSSLLTIRTSVLLRNDVFRLANERLKYHCIWTTKEHRWNTPPNEETVALKVRREITKLLLLVD